MYEFADHAELTMSMTLYCVAADEKLIENPYNAFSLTLLFPILLKMQIDSNCGIDGRAVLMID